MRPDEWWKNFGLGQELDVAGAFIYNGIKHLNDTEYFQHPVDTFEILYNLSVGIERLTKIAIILVEHDEGNYSEEFEESLITHNTQELIERLNRHYDLRLSDIHKEFVALLSKFYKTHRYARYSLKSVPNIYEEKVNFLAFISKHLQLNLDFHDEFNPIYNTKQIKKFIGKIVQRIVRSIFKVIQDQTTRLNIYTDELRGDSKAIWVFYSDRLDFINEIILYLMNPKTSGAHIDLLRSFDALELDPGMTPYYIKALLNDYHLFFVEGEVEEAYTEIKNLRNDWLS